MKFSQISFIVLFFVAYVGNVLLFSTFLKDDQLVQTKPETTIEISIDCQELHLANQE